MNSFLRFKSRKISNSYYTYINRRLLNLIIIYDLLFFIGTVFYLIHLIMTYINESKYFIDFSKSTILILIILIFIYILFFILQSLWLNYKKKTFYDTILLFNFILSTIILIESYVDSQLFRDYPRTYFIWAHRLGLYNLITLFCYKRLISKLIHILFILIYYEIRIFGPERIDAGSLIYNIFASILVLVLLYFHEKNDKNAYLSLIQSDKEKKSFENFLNILPEGVAILEKKLSPLFTNTSMKILFEEDDSNRLTEKLLRDIKKKTNFANLKIANSNSCSNSRMSLQIENNEIDLFHIIENYIEELIKRKSLKNSKESIEKYIKNSNLRFSAFRTSEFSKMESFIANYQEKTFQIKLISVKYNKSEAILVMANDTTESVRLKLIEDANDYKQSLFSSFTHEFKTPLNCLFVMLHKLLIDKNIPVEIKENFVKPACYNSEILSNLVNSISDYSLLMLHKFRLDRKTINLREFFDKTIEPLRFQSFCKNLDCIVSIKDDVPNEIRTDPRRLEEILFQLYSNAIKFTYEGYIKITVKRVKEIENCIKIAIKDSGVGIDEHQLNNLNEFLNNKYDAYNYKKISDNSVGASLGLTVSHIIAKKLGLFNSEGIQIKSKIGKGSKFYFIIRIKGKDSESSMKNLYNFNSIDDSAGLSIEKSIEKKKTDKVIDENAELLSFDHSTNRLQIHDESYLEKNRFLQNEVHEATIDFSPNEFSVSNKSSCNHPKVLVVDDDEFNILALKTLIGTRKLSILSARNGKLAIELIENECALRKNCCLNFKVIFMDLNMPILNGIKASQILKEKATDNLIPKCNIVACTAFEANIEKKDCLNAGMCDFITKPINIKKINEILDKWVFNNEFD